LKIVHEHIFHDQFIRYELLYPDLFVFNKNKFISPAIKIFLINIFVSQNHFLTVSMQLFMRQ